MNSKLAKLRKSNNLSFLVHYCIIRACNIPEDGTSREIVNKTTFLKIHH